MDLSEWRDRIDNIDQQLIDLLNQRMHCALEIGKIKRAHNQPIRDPDREKAIINRIKQHNDGPITDQALEELYTRIMAESRNLESE